jgi:tetratricopeptide (TPR) repeat protein
LIDWLLCGLALAQAVNPGDAARKAIQDFEAGRYTEAQVEFRRILQVAPADPGLWAYLGLTESSLNDTQAAIRDFEKARSLSPRDPEILLNLGGLYARANNPDPAREMYRIGLGLKPDDVTANQNYALLLMQAGQYDGALAPLSKLLILRPDDLSIRVSLIECNLKAGKDQESRRQLQSFLAMPECTLTKRIKTAQVFVEDHLPQLAETVLEDTVQRYDESAAAHAALGRLLLDSKEYENAVVQFGRAAQLEPSAASYSLGLADGLLQWRHFQPAYEFLKAVEPKFGTLPEFRYDMGLALYGLNLFSRALNEFQAFTAVRPNADVAWFFEASCLANEGQLEKAEALYRKAIALNDRNPAYYTALGEVLRRDEQDRTRDAIDVFKRALAIKPDDPMAQEQLALCYERERQLEQAEQLLQKAVEMDPRFQQAHVALARVYYKLHKTADGDREKAIASSLQADASKRIPPEPR